MKAHNPAKSAQPKGPYSLGVEVPPNARWLAIAGQVPLAADGSVPQGIKAQSEQVWRNILNVLESAGMGVENLVKVNHYLTKPESNPGLWRSAQPHARRGATGLHHGRGGVAGDARMAGRG